MEYAIPWSCTFQARIRSLIRYKSAKNSKFWTKFASPSSCRLVHAAELLAPAARVKHYDTSAEHINASVEASLRDMATDQIDLLLIHRPDALMDPDELANTFEGLRAAGKVLHFGVSNHTPSQLALLNNRIGLATNQIELHPRLQQADLRAFHAAHGIVTQSWTPLGQGKSFVAAPVAAAAARTGKSPAQVILRWHLHLGCSVIPRSTRAAGLAENLDLFDFALTEDEMAAIATLDAGERTGPDPAVFS